MRVKALVLDVDGVLTDASLFYSARASRSRHSRHGTALPSGSRDRGITVAILSGRLAGP